jgi:5'-3' exonuclease
MEETNNDGLRILLIDVSAIFWAAWHATAEADGRAAFDRTIKKCRELSLGWDRVAICVDAGDSERREILPEYKANRGEKPAPAIEQRDRAIEYLRSDGFHIFTGDGFEADDTIATICAWAQDSAEVAEVMIACVDKDLLQLVGGKVQVASPQTGVVLDAAGVEAKMGAKPSLIPDLLGLVGDKADNIPGCPGVGEKTASDLLLQYGDLDDVAKAAEDGKMGGGKRGENLYSHREAYLLSRDLIRLRTDSPVDPEEILVERERKETPPPPGPEEVPDGTPDGSLPALGVEKPKGFDEFAGTALVPVEFSMELEPRNMKQANWVASRVIDSKLFAGYGNTEAALLCILAGRDFGISAMASLRGFHIIEGKLSMSAQLVAGIIIKSGKAEYFEPVLDECTDKTATWVTKRGDRPEQRYTYTIEMAARAKLITSRSNWEKRPETMLLWRSCVGLGRAIYPDIIGNVYTEADWSTPHAA